MRLFFFVFVYGQAAIIGGAYLIMLALYARRRATGQMPRGLALRPRVHAVLWAHLVASVMVGVAMMGYSIYSTWPMTAPAILNGQLLFALLFLPIHLSPLTMLWNNGPYLIHGYLPPLSQLLTAGFYTGIFLFTYRWRYRGFYQAKMLALGNCIVCGYHLIATPDRCPECGAFPTMEARSAALGSVNDAQPAQPVAEGDFPLGD